MQIHNAEAIGRDPNGPLSVTYATYKDMYDNNIVYAYKGIVTSDLVEHVLDLMEERLEEDGKESKIAKKVFNVMVESLNNIYADETQMVKDEYDPTAMLLVKRTQDYYTVITGSQIPRQKVAKIKQLVDKINQLDPSELKAFYQEMLNEGVQDESGVTALGILDLARKSRNVLTYSFKYLNPDFSYFSLEARISSSND